MAIDPYSTCPGGTGKKLKFCCSDLVGELDKIQRMIEGEQHVACLDYIAKLESKYPERACLMALRSIIELTLEKHDEAAATINAFLRKYPENPLADARLALLRVVESQPKEAVAAVLQAIEVSGDEISDDVYRALGSVAVNIVRLGLLIPARALLQWQYELAGGKDERPAALLFSLQTDPSIPLLLKEEPPLAPPPDGAPWKFEFDVAYQRAIRRDWKVAAEKFAALTALAGQSPALWRIWHCCAAGSPIIRRWSRPCGRIRCSTFPGTMQSRPRHWRNSMTRPMPPQTPPSLSRSSMPWRIRLISKNVSLPTGNSSEFNSIHERGNPMRRTGSPSFRRGPFLSCSIDRSQRPPPA